MSSLENYPLAKFGIDEIYIHKGLSHSLLEKLHQRAAFSLDAENNVIQKHVSHDMILIFYNRISSQSLICQFLKFLDLDKDKDSFIKSNTLINEEELFSAIKSKKFVLITPKTLEKETYDPD